MKQKRFITFLFMTFITVLALFSCAGAEQQKPTASVEGESYQFDSVLDGAQVVHDFTVSNKGNAVLEIEKVETG
jgi:hypothetical protein